MKWFVIAFVLLSLAACGGGQQNSQSSMRTPVVHQTVSQPSVPVVSTHHHKVGETVDASGWTITLNSVHTQAHFDYGIVPSKAGDVFLVVTLTAQNILTKEESLQDSQFVLRDTDGNGYGAQFGTGHNIVVERVEAGAPLKGDLSYEVPATVHQFVLQFAPDVTDVIPPTVIWDLKVS